VRARAALICYHGEGGGFTAEFTYWEGVKEARQAEEELAQPCGSLCRGVHSVARLDLEPEPRRRRSLRTRTTSTAGADAAGT
jgi:hypothetical protein